MGIFLPINLRTLLILFHSKFSFTEFDPGLVDSPPMSINFAPDLIKLFEFT